KYFPAPAPASWKLAPPGAKANALRSVAKVAVRNPRYSTGIEVKVRLPPAEGLVMVMVGLVPPIRCGMAVNIGWDAEASLPWQVQATAVTGSGPPPQATFPEPMVESAARADWICAAVAL